MLVVLVLLVREYARHSRGILDASLRRSRGNFAVFARHGVWRAYQHAGASESNLEREKALDVLDFYGLWNGVKIVTDEAYQVVRIVNKIKSW